MEESARELINEDDEMYDAMAASRNTADMKNFGEVEKHMFHHLAKHHPELAEKWVTRLKASKWHNYMSKAEAEQVKAEGEAAYMQILSEAYNDPYKADFYNFVRSLDAAKLSLIGSGDNVLYLTPDSPLAALFYQTEELQVTSPAAARTADADSENKASESGGLESPGLPE